jgi:hypothetical protein
MTDCTTIKYSMILYKAVDYSSIKRIFAEKLIFKHNEHEQNFYHDQA